MFSRPMLGLALSIALGGFGLVGTPAANADCVVNVGSGDCTGGECVVNVDANCHGECDVNALDDCTPGQDCLLNTPVLDICGQNGVAVSGSGTIDPGLPCPSTGCDVDLAFTAVFGGDNATGTASCTFDGRDTHPGGATATTGSGSGTIACSGGVSASGTVFFNRTGTVVRVSGSITVDGSSCTVDVTLTFVPGGPPPVTTFSVHGGGTVTCT